jgi:hypothetical protein
VDEDSAKLAGYPCFGLPLDHFQLNKFSSPEDGNFQRIVDALRKFCQERETLTNQPKINHSRVYVYMIDMLPRLTNYQTAITWI